MQALTAAYLHVHGGGYLFGSPEGIRSYEPLYRQRVRRYGVVG